jgi:phosphonate transport system ATP-binding protein
MAQSLITLNGASAGYAGHAVLHDINLTISAGERIAVMGRSGAGKSTLLNLIYEKLAVDIALIPQATALVKTLSVFHNVYMGCLDRHSAFYNLRNLVWPYRRDVAQIESLLESVDLGDKIFAKAGALSGGQQQRTSVARALYNGRHIIIGDEPVSSLDRVQATGILKLLRERSETVILALHDIQLALAHTERIIVLDGGRIVLDAPASTLSASDLVPYYGG